MEPDFCLISPPGTIGDSVYCDTDNDVVQGPGEPGIGGAVVTLVCAGPDCLPGTADDLVETQATQAGATTCLIR